MLEEHRDQLRKEESELTDEWVVTLLIVLRESVQIALRGWVKEQHRLGVRGGDNLWFAGHGRRSAAMDGAGI